MTTRIADEVARRKQRGRPRGPRTLEEDFGLECRALRMRIAVLHVLRWPSKKYQKDPFGFFHDILGIQLAPHQIEIVEAVRDSKRVAVASGHKIGKSLILAGLALWFYCSFPDARVVMSSTTSRQVDSILWRELRKMHAGAGRCVACKTEDPEGKKIPAPCSHSAFIDGEPHELARSGLKSNDFREAVGFTAREAEAVAGISGAHVLYLVDEASGVTDPIFEAIEGNRAAGARIVMTSNPTKTEGYFFEAFESKKEFWRVFQISSESVTGYDIPGLCSQEWIDEMRAEYGADSVFYLVRVRGQFPIGDAGKIISLHLITEAQNRWKDAPAVGRLHIGVDPAGPGGMGDESAFAVRRGKKIVSLHARRALTPEAHLVEVLGLLKNERQPRDPPPLVVIDREGAVGAKVWVKFVEHVERHKDAFILAGVRSSERRSDPRRVYDLVRDELWANLHTWLSTGGAIPEDARLAKELHAPEWSLDVHNRQKATGKQQIRKILGNDRSPDRADAVTLAVWDPVVSVNTGPQRAVELYDQPREIDAYEIDGFGPTNDPVYG